MKQIHMDALDAKLDVQDNLYYHDDGIVNSVDDHTKILDKKYKFDTERKPSSAGGRFYSMHKGKQSILDALNSGVDVDIHIYVEHAENPDKTLYRQGHEEGHVLELIERYDVMKECLARQDIGSEGIEDLKGESFAHLGGICALLNEDPSFKTVNVNGSPIEIVPTFEFINRNGAREFRLPSKYKAIYIYQKLREKLKL